MRIIRIVTHKHMSRCTHKDRVDINGTKQGREQYTTVHTVDLRGFQRIVKRTDTLREYDIA